MSIMRPPRHIFHNAVVQMPAADLVPCAEGKFPVYVLLYQETRRWFNGPEDFEMVGDRSLVAAEGIVGCREAMYTCLTVRLFLMSVPEEEVAAIILKFDRKLSEVSDVPSNLPIVVLVTNITAFFLGTADYDQVSAWIEGQAFVYLGNLIRRDRCRRDRTRFEDRIRRARTIGDEHLIVGRAANDRALTRGGGEDRISRAENDRARTRGGEDHISRAENNRAIEESIVSYKARYTPAAESFIQGLKKIRLDSLEEDVIRETPCCAICLEEFAKSVEEPVTSLPCKHYFHADCIVLCLEISHLCPYCRYAMPTVEAGEEPSTEATAAN